MRAASGWTSRARASTAMPSTRGMLRSLTTTSKRWAERTSSAASPPSAKRASQPDGRRRSESARPPRMHASSSTKSTRSGTRLMPRDSSGTIGASEDCTTFSSALPRPASRPDGRMAQSGSNPPPRRGARSGARAALCDRSHACGLARKAANLLMTMSLFPTSLPARAGRRAGPPVAVAAQRLGPRLLPIAHTAAAAVLAWYVALAIVPDPRPSFASIAAVISVGATYGHRGRRAAELIGGVVLGLSVADLVVRLIGVGPLQMGLMVLVAMSTAVVLGGGALLVTEAAVSALLLLAAADPTAATIGPGLSPMRMAEALIGGAIALGVTSVFFPPDPALMVGRAVQSVFAGLGRSLERIAGALEDRDAAGAGHALAAARDIDWRIDALDDAFAAARETARLA